MIPQFLDVFYSQMKIIKILLSGLSQLLISYKKIQGSSKNESLMPLFATLSIILHILTGSIWYHLFIPKWDRIAYYLHPLQNFSSLNFAPVAYAPNS